MYARSNCSVSPATAEIAGSFNGISVAFMEFWPGRVKRKREATIELRVKAMQRVASRSVAENRLARAKQPAFPAWRLVPPRRVFAALTVQSSLPWRDRSGCEQGLYFCRSKHNYSAPYQRLRGTFSDFPCAFSRVSLRNYFPAVTVQLLRARSRRTMRREALPLTTWTTGRANVRCGEEIRARPCQLTVFRDSIRRGSRTGNSEVLGTSRR